MTDTQQGVVLLLKSAITGEKYPLPQNFSMEEAAAMARKHQMVSLIHTGAVNCGISGKDPHMQALFLEAAKGLMKSEKQLRQIRRITDTFDANSIDYMLLKGTNLKRLYPRPELRTMGDADILIRTDQYPRIRPLLLELDFREDRETDHELIWQRPELFLELHKHLIPSYTRDYYAYFGNGWQLAKREQGSRYTLSHEDEFIFLVTHFAKHYRDGGAGCRYILDLWVYRRHFPDLNEGYVRQELDKLQIVEFYDNLCRMIHWWFDGGVGDPVTEFLSESIFTSGTWGQLDAKLASRGLRESRIAGSIRKGRFRRLMVTLFPPANILQQRYPVLEKHPWLLPVFWPVRWITALLFRRQNIRIQRRIHQGMTPDQIRSREEALRCVGLDFHFGSSD